MAGGEGEKAITAEEAKLYDRQIRVWGMEAQKRMRNSKICIVRLAGLATEVVKNIVLAGIGELTVLDSENVSERDLESNFFLTKSEIGKNRAESGAPRIRELNPNVVVNVDTDSIKEKDSKFFRSFDVVICCDCALPVQAYINELCRDSKVGGKDPVFFASITIGFDAVFFEDVGPNFQYMMKTKKTGEETKNSNGSSSSASAFEIATGVPIKDIASSVTFSQCKMALKKPRKNRWYLKLASKLAILLRCAAEEKLDFSEKCNVSIDGLKKYREALSTSELQGSSILSDSELEQTAKALGKCLSPVLSVVGGILGQEALKVISRKGKPYRNTILFDAKVGGAAEMALMPPKMEATSDNTSRKRKIEYEVLDLI